MGDSQPQALDSGGVNQNTLIENGQVRTGIFSEPIILVHPSDFDFRTPLGKKQGPMARRMRYKQFHYLGGISDNLIFGAAVADLRYLCTGFYYVYDLKTGKELRHTWRAPLSRRVKFSENPETGSVSFGDERNGIHVECAGGRRRLHVRRQNQSVIDVSLEDSLPEIEPLRICTRAGYTGWVYVRKTGGVHMQGRVDCELGQFDAGECLGHTDFSAGYMRPETWWNWAFVSGTANGQALGINVSCGVNETSYSENCYWLGGRLHLLPQTRFEFNPGDPMSEWRVHSDALALSFKPAGVHTEHVNAGILASRFNQVYGRFEGSVRLPGLPEAVPGLQGFVEDHYARW